MPGTRRTTGPRGTCWGAAAMANMSEDRYVEYCVQYIKMTGVRPDP
eukprot:CAMPEP_0182854866 /NCGR_PEP_ID=MMETSP0034_2-20130328/1514_1 /TAXON_ID=156128 /ORGANISM="Nephroselmis pyriformis, Strain CCMP717" /LENGTH=45 /DNA_ID= /DNA_START= /DNA_END= /DNA_ORIENTATION=